jgi:hypothetical protein
VSGPNPIISFTAKVSKGMDELVKSQAVERTIQIPVKRFKEAYAI